jgi:hypothetical protein
MIKKRPEPEVWPAPEWHPDFGDAKSELEHLRSFPTALLANIPEAQVELELPEPGLMSVAVQMPNGSSAEVYSVASIGSPGQRRYGLFLAPDTPNEREVYEDALESSVKRLTDDVGLPSP